MIEPGIVGATLVLALTPSRFLAGLTSIAAYSMARGMDVVHAIWRSKAGAPDGGMGAQKLTPPIRIVSAKRI